LIQEVAVDATEVNAIASSKALDIVAGLGVAPIATGNEDETIDIVTKFKSFNKAELTAAFNDPETKRAYFAALKPNH
jgi:hypothetical protein